MKSVKDGGGWHSWIVPDRQSTGKAWLVDGARVESVPRASSKSKSMELRLYAPKV